MKPPRRFKEVVIGTHGFISGAGLCARGRKGKHHKKKTIAPVGVLHQPSCLGGSGCNYSMEPLSVCDKGAF